MANAGNEAPNAQELRSAMPASGDLEARRAKAGVAAALFGESESEPVMVGRYEIRSRIGAGGMGVVYEAHDPELDRPIAIKLLNPTVSSRDEGGRRMLREARSLARLAHPNVITVHDVGSFGDAGDGDGDQDGEGGDGGRGGQVFLAMELVDGSDLRRHLHDESIPWSTVLQLYLDAGRGLAAAHEAGLVHRDFKPENVLVGKDGRVRVLDFGLARALPDAERSTLDAGLTADGAIVGTPLYMSPEQYDEKPADAASDQFSFCVACYEGLYRQKPFRGETLASHISNLVAGRVQGPPEDAEVPRSIYRVLRRGMVTDPAQRWPNMDALIEALQAAAALDNEAEGTRRGGGSSLIVLGIVGAAAFVVAAGVLSVGVVRERAGERASEGTSVVATALGARGDSIVTTARAAPRVVRLEFSAGAVPTAVEPEDAVPASTDWCYFHGDDYRLLRRTEKRFAGKQSISGQCYVCRKERRRERIAGLRPRDCSGFAMCLQGDGCP